MTTASDQRGWPLPSRRVTARLRPDERLVAATRQHWVVPASQISVPTLVAAVLIWLAGTLPPGLNALLDVGWIIWLGLLVRMFWRLWGWSVKWFAVTDERLLLSYGRLNHKLAMMPLSKVTDMTYVRTSPGQTLGYGEFVLESAGQDQALHRVRLLPRSQRLYDLIYEQLARRDRARHGRGERGGRRGESGTGVEAVPPDEGVREVRVRTAAGSTRAGRTPDPVRAAPSGAVTQMLDTGRSRRGERGGSDRAVSGSSEQGRAEPAPRRPGPASWPGRLWRVVSGGPPRARPTTPRQQGTRARAGSVLRRFWAAVRGDDGERL